MSVESSRDTKPSLKLVIADAMGLGGTVPLMGGQVIAVYEAVRNWYGDDRLLSARELAEYLGVHEDTVYAMAQRGEIPVAFRAGPRLRFDRDKVLAAQKAQPEREETR